MPAAVEVEHIDPNWFPKPSSFHPPDQSSIKENNNSNNNNNSGGDMTPNPLKDDEDQDSTDQEEDSDLQEYSDEPVHADGVPRCDVKLLARQHRTPEFIDTVFQMLRNDLGLNGWSNLPDSLKTSVSIHKVGGSLTNAVFFVTCPTSSATKGQATGVDAPASTAPDLVVQEPPTVLLRIYGPSSGSLISRKHELHLLHTLSAQYGIGPLLLGTFYNGRVEQFFRSRALTKEEVREPGISCSIARKMRQLHSVDLSSFTFADDPDRPVRKRSIGTQPRQGRVGSTCASINTAKSWSSSYTSESDAPVSGPCAEQFALGTLSSRDLVSSPSSITSPDASRVTTKQARVSVSCESINGKHSSSRARAGAWQNITRWQQEAAKVLDEVKKLSKHFDLPIDGTADSMEGFRSSSHPSPLSNSRALVDHFRRMDIPRLISEMKAYRNWVHSYEKLNGRSPRVFSHNDTQCGNLLLLQIDQDFLPGRSDDQIVVIDFEYASPNPRGFDIANHFHEWCADYHHPTLSFSLTKHGKYPSLVERKRFYRAYLGLDTTITANDLMTSESERNNNRSFNFRHVRPMAESLKKCFGMGSKGGSYTTKDEGEGREGGGEGFGEKIRFEDQGEIFGGCSKEESQVNRLEEEVNVWSPASHAMWALWGIVQARDDLKPLIERWMNEVEEGNFDEVEFDYLSYSIERIDLFRDQLKALGV